MTNVKFNKPKVAHFAVNTAGRDFVVGDLHGQIHLLEQFMGFIQFDPLRDRMFSVGDLVDRGQDSFGCLMLLDFLWFKAVKSNHEQLMEDALTGGPTGSWWIPNGGEWFTKLDSIGKQEVVNKLRVVQELPWMITVDLPGTRKFHVIHAEFESQEVITDELLANEEFFDTLAAGRSLDGHSLLWGRTLFRDLFAKDVNNHFAQLHFNTMKKRGFLDHFTDELSPVFSGHTPMRKPTTIGKQTNIDTMAFGVTRHSWAGLTICEPLTNKFWTVKNDDIFEVEPLVIG